MMPVSKRSIDKNETSTDLIEEVALTIYENKIWSGFLCIIEPRKQCAMK